MSFGQRMPSLRKRVTALTSRKRYTRQSLGLNALRGMGWITNPRRATYNRAYHRLIFDPLRPGRRRPGYLRADRPGDDPAGDDRGVTGGRFGRRERIQLPPTGTTLHSSPMTTVCR